MSELKLTLEDYPTKVIAMDRTYEILHDYLQPNSVLSVEAIRDQIIALLPDKAPMSPEMLAVVRTFLELAEQIPYHHPSQLKLVDLLVYLGQSTKFTDIHKSTETQVEYYYCFQQLGQSLRDNLIGPEPENPIAYVNFHAFAANVFEHRLFRITDPDWAIWALRDGLEETHDKENEKGVRDAYILAAAQWILWFGQTLYKSLLLASSSSKNSGLKEERAWRPGPMYSGKAVLSIDRWHFWIDRFIVYGSSSEKPDRSVLGPCSEECQRLARKAAEMMDVLERSLSF